MLLDLLPCLPSVLTYFHNSEVMCKYFKQVWHQKYTLVRDIHPLLCCARLPTLSPRPHFSCLWHFLNQHFWVREVWRETVTAEGMFVCSQNTWWSAWKLQLGLLENLEASVVCSVRCRWVDHLKIYRAHLIWMKMHIWLIRSNESRDVRMSDWMYMQRSWQRHVHTRVSIITIHRVLGGP